MMKHMIQFGVWLIKEFRTTLAIQVSLLNQSSININHYNVMSHKYDIDSDQLKCNFCTQWFKTTLHYANLQRYSLKACNKCLSNFNYTLLHPSTYQIYKLFLFDLNINIPSPHSQSEIIHQMVLQFNIAKDEVRSKIAGYYESKIKELMVEMESATIKMEQFSKNVEARYLSKIKLEECDKLEKTKQQILRKIDQFKNMPVGQWSQDRPKLIKNASSAILASIAKPAHSFNKENEPINKASCKAIRDKINKPPIQRSSKDSKVLSKSKQSHQVDNSLSKSLKRSVIMRSAKCLDNSRIWTPNSSFQQSERAQIERLLEHHNSRQTYLPFEVARDNSFLHKFESKRNHADSILDLRSRTSKGGELIQLIGAQASKLNFQCFLESLGSQSCAKVVRVIKSGITDYDFDALLKFTARHSAIQTLIVTNNHLTEISISALTNFLRKNPKNSLKRVYMGNNRILRDRLPGAMRQIEQRGVQVCL